MGATLAISRATDLPLSGIAPPAYLAGIQLSGVLWAAAFGLYAVHYWPVLTRPRVDGKPG